VDLQLGSGTHERKLKRPEKCSALKGKRMTNVSAEFQKKFADRLKILLERQQNASGANILLLGESGAGKTYLLRDMPGPIYVDSFDARGQDTNRALFGPNYFVDTRYEKISYKTPNGFSKWEDTFMYLRDSGFFEQIGTYVIDSITGWSRALSYYIADRMMKIGEAKSKGDSAKANREYGILQLSDYNITLNLTVSYLHEMFALPCNVVIIGHLADKWSYDEKGIGTFLGREMTLDGQKVIREIFNNTSEVWVVKPKLKSNSDIERVLYTAPTSFFDKARTRIGADVFEPIEKPNLRELLSKAGYDTTDKPPLDFILEDKKEDQSQ
jgi:hypothetical protein